MAGLVSLGTGARAQQADAKGSGTLSLTGCLDRTNDGTYELRNARSAPAGTAATPGSSAPTPGATAGTSGAANSAGAGEVPTTWVLKSTSDLAPHVGHTVQVTGRMSAPEGTGGSNTATTTPPTTTATGARIKKPGEEAKSIDVQAVRMISRACE